MEFSYKVRTQNNQLIDGVIEAPDEDNAVSLLHAKGYVILTLDNTQKDLFTFDVNDIFSRPNKKDIIAFTRQLSTLIEANVPISESLRTLAKQVEKQSFQKVVTNIAELVEGGSSLSLAFGSHSKFFDNFYIKLVRSGETTGKLQETLLYLADYLERTESINSKIKSALSYPAFVVFAMIVVGVIMGVYVLPQLLAIFEESGVEDLPITTRILIFLVDIINTYFIYIAILLIGLAIVAWQYIKTPNGRAQFDAYILKIPKIGKIIRNLLVSRMSESLSTMIKSQIPILDGLKITANLVGNEVYKKILLTAEENVRGGGTMSEIFVQASQVPPLLSSMVSIGEKTGKMDYMLEHISKFYKQESENDIQTLTQLIEPILILVLGLGVAILVSSILLPIYNLVGAA